MALIRGLINIPTTIGGERVACVFPCIGGAEHQTFVDAQIVTVSGEDEKGTACVWSTYLYWPTSLGGDVIVGEKFTSFPKAIRHARQLQGWG